MSFLKELGKIGGDILNGVTSGIPGMIVGAGSSLIGGAISDMFSDGNQQQAQAWNEKQFEEQKKLWYEQQEYNSPENQVNRLREAGINPQLALGNIQSGQMGSLPSTPTMGANSVNLGNINNAISGLLDYEVKSALAEEEIKGRKIDNQTRFLENILRIHDIMADIDVKGSNSYKARTDADIARMMATPNIMKIFSDIENNASITAINTIKFVSDLEELKFLPTRQKLEYAERMTNISKMEAETETEKQHKLYLVEQTNHEFFKAQGQHFVNTLNKKTEQFMIDKSRYEAERLKNPKNIWDAGFEGMEGFNKFVDKNFIKPSKRLWKDTRRSFGF